MDTSSGLAAVHSAASLGSKVTAMAPAAQPAADRVDAPAATGAQPKMIGMPEAEYNAHLAEANASGRADGAKAASSRIKSIISAPEAKGRESLAQSIAFDTELSLEQATSMLKAAPEAQKVSRLDGNVPAPQVNASEAAGKETASAGLASAVQKMVVKKFGAAPAA